MLSMRCSVCACKNMTVYLLAVFSAATEKDNGSDKESVASKHSESGEKKTGKLEVESQTTDRR